MKILQLKQPPRPKPRPLPRPSAVVAEPDPAPQPVHSREARPPLQQPAVQSRTTWGVQPMTADEFAAASTREYFRARKVMGLPPDFTFAPAHRHAECLELARADREQRHRKALGLADPVKKVSEVKGKLFVKKQK